MNRYRAQDSIDDVLEDADSPLTIEEIADYLNDGYENDPDLALIDNIAVAGRVLNTASRLPLANPVPRDIGFFLLAWAVEMLVGHRHFLMGMIRQNSS